MVIYYYIVLFIIIIYFNFKIKFWAYFPHFFPVFIWLSHFDSIANNNN